MYIPTLCASIDALDPASQAQLNGTSPWTVVSPGWAPAPDAGRGTMTIIWSCLATIFACSWTITHPKMPGRGKWDSSKVKLCVVAVVAPEMLAFTALEEYLMVRDYYNAINHIKKGHWTMSQLFFVFIGGVDLVFEDCTETLGSTHDGKFHSSESLHVLRRAVQLSRLDINSISIEDISKRAKTNYIVKALICLQASWLVAQVIDRAVAKIPITTIEVVTVGYVVCALITYSSWWHKPQDAEVLIALNHRNLTKAAFYQDFNQGRYRRLQEKWWQRVLLSVVCGTFGAVHCIAWNFYFSTFAESVTWRVASVLTVVIPFTSGCLMALESSQSDSLSIIYGVFLVLYIPVRLYLMIEPFVAFRFVPVGIFYTVDWSSWIPHV